MSPRPLAPWLTVIVPTHRGEQWIDASLRSLAADAAEGVEVLVLDSSPTPTTLDIARGYSDRLHLRAVERRDLLMWHAKTNLGVQIAEASHICWLHQDDLWLPGRAAAVRAWIESAPKAPLHLAPSAIIDRSGRTLGVWQCPLPPNGELPSVLVTERLLVQNFVAAPAPVFRKDAWLACGGLDEKLWYTADWDIWLKLAASGPVYYHDGVTTGFRIHGGSLTVAGSRDVADFAQQMQIVLDRHLPRFCDRSKSVERAGRASIAVNTALAAASAGDLRGLLPAVSRVLRLGPAGICRSRLPDRGPGGAARAGETGRRVLNMGTGPFIRRMFGPYERQISEFYRAAFFDLDAIVERMRQWAPNATKILEVGCGEGAVTERLNAAYPFAKITAIDITPRLGRLYEGSRDKVRFIRCNVQKIAATEPGQYDLVVLCDVLHHVPVVFRQDLLDAIRATLAPGGAFVLKEWERTSTPIHWLCYASDRWVTGDRIRYMTCDETRELLAGSFGETALIAEARFAPWRNNIATLVRP